MAVYSLLFGHAEWPEARKAPASPWRPPLPPRSTWFGRAGRQSRPPLEAASQANALQPCPRVYDDEPAAAQRFARVTLSVPAALKGRVEASAALEGVPEHTWIVRALARSVDPRVQLNP